MTFQHPFPGDGVWLKGNTHIHSTASDGGKTFDELEALYRSAKYDFLFRTDHWVCSDAGTQEDSTRLLWLDGIELDGCDHGGSGYHVVCLGKVIGLDQKQGLVSAMESARAQGAMLILAHPYWSGNSLADATRYGFHGVEIYNHVCHWLNGKGDGNVYWDAMLHAAPKTLAFAADDAHLKKNHQTWNGGWIMVYAANRSRAAILDAIRRGAFYSSCGPEIHHLQCDGAALHVQTSPVKYMRLVGPGSEGVPIGAPDGGLMTSTSLTWPKNWEYAFLEIEDVHGRRARTNNLLISNQR